MYILYKTPLGKAEWSIRSVSTSDAYHTRVNFIRSNEHKIYSVLSLIKGLEEFLELLLPTLNVVPI